MSATPITVSDAIRRRSSTRSFLPTPVDEATVRDLLALASRAPSGGNLQPWKVIVVAGSARDAVVNLAKNFPGILPNEEGDRPVYPPNLWEPYRSRRYKVGEDLYGLLGIGRDNKPARLRQLARNFEFFGAPIGVFFVIERAMGHGQWAHLGMYMQTLALVATERRLATCFQEFWGTLRVSLHKHFQLAEGEMIYCGMALGHADESAVINRLHTDRAPVDEFAKLLFDK